MVQGGIQNPWLRRYEDLLIHSTSMIRASCSLCVVQIHKSDAALASSADFARCRLGVVLPSVLDMAAADDGEQGVAVLAWHNSVVPLQTVVLALVLLLGHLA